MTNIIMKNEAGIAKGYEFYQIVKDFDNPLQIFREAFQNSVDADATELVCHVYIKRNLDGQDLFIDIYDNGHGILKQNIDSFFGLAQSTKVDDNKVKKSNKLGYKGHGAKIFFNSECVSIASKTECGEYWAATCINPIKQLSTSMKLCYSDPLEPRTLNMNIPTHYSSGFMIRIKNPYYFNTQSTLYMLNHDYLRDYIKWYTVFGTILTHFNDEKWINDKKIVLFLRSINADLFREEYPDYEKIDPVPQFIKVHPDIADEKGVDKEVIPLGHYFPQERKDDVQMTKYLKSIPNCNKSFVDFYSHCAVKDNFTCSNGTRFKFILNLEGYETKRRYDILLSRRGKNGEIKYHTDSNRYGIWACKGGVPIERIDDWYKGGKGSYTYMHAFVDCDDFDLTANRGSIKNINLEIIEQIKQKLNSIMNGKKVLDAIETRDEWEKFEKTQRTIDEDDKELKKRYKEAGSKERIIFQDSTEIFAPRKLKTGYSESETMTVLTAITIKYPDLFKFKVLDYNTTKGIDYVIEEKGSPGYIELKGTLNDKMNHSLRLIRKIICFDVDVKDGGIIKDDEGLQAELKIIKNAKFDSNDIDFKGKNYTYYKLESLSPAITSSIEVIVLKKLLKEVIGTSF